ncbi:UDP-GlcNAc:undecaprenyl-phosphate GlcNAc-1-phosphate transferase [Desulfitispora alkaliphila]|uniref:glycosyltransferase family 4 protein n=1 Tax=Desulfitispora alkaliphila TaxID=622674 RepID=UPI003D25D0CA
MEKAFLAMMLAFIVALVLTPVVKSLAFRVGAVDNPEQRKVHKKIMPRMGGLAIYLGFIGAVLTTQPLTNQIIGLLLGGTIIVVIGIADDIVGLQPKVKLLGQIVAASVLVLFGIGVEFVTNPFDGMISLGILSIPFTILWIVGVTNAVNLIDGLDGLAGGVTAIAATTLAVVAWTEGQTLYATCALILAASTMGFLKYNFYPAKIFMGDTGSMFLGFNLATLAVLGLGKGATVISLFIPIVILGIPILDTAFAIVRRYMKNQPIFKADKEHLHHCLLAVGLSHKQTVLVIYGLNSILGASAVMLTMLTTAQAVMILLILFTGIVLGAEKIGVVGTRAIESTGKTYVSGK